MDLGRILAPRGARNAYKPVWRTGPLHAIRTLQDSVLYNFGRKKGMRGKRRVEVQDRPEETKKDSASDDKL